MQIAAEANEQAAANLMELAPPVGQMYHTQLAVAE